MNGRVFILKEYNQLTQLQRGRSIVQIFFKVSRYGSKKLIKVTHIGLLTQQIFTFKVLVSILLLEKLNNPN